jgi:hypothetical protein
VTERSRKLILPAKYYYNDKSSLCDDWGMWHARERKMHTKFRNETQKKVGNLEEIGIYRRIISNKYDG